ncbi:MAG: TonB-dependent receptor [Leptospirales bacterium]|nr:TonB-dependent receptor [Leptospirales bacterium]
MRPLFRTLFTITVCFTALLAFSQEEQNKENTKNSRAGEILIKDKKAETGTVSIIDGSAVKETTKTDAVNLISERVASFHTGNNRVMGFGLSGSGAAAMSIRGAGLSGWGPTTGIPILINGMDAGMMVNNHPVADIFSMKNIDRIEILHGPQPVIYGDGALAGVINIITKRRQIDGFDTEISGSYGSWNTTDNYISHNGKISDFDYGLSYNFRYTDGARKQTIGTSPNDYKFDSRYLSHNGTFHTGFQVNQNWYTAINGYLMKMNFHDPGPKGYMLNDLEYFDVTRGGGTLSINNNYNKLSGSLQIYYNAGTHKANQPARNEDTYDSFDQMFGAKLKEKISFDTGTSLTGGAEYRRHGGRAKSRHSTTGRVFHESEYIDEGSGFALAEQSLLDNIWLISGGGRYTYNSESGNHASWQAGTLLNPLRGTKLHFQSARGFKAPDIIQYYSTMAVGGPFPFLPLEETGEKLKAETYTSFEAGLEQSLLDIITGSVTFYRMYTNNKFSTRPSDTIPNRTEWYNADNFDYNGVEAAIDVRPIKWLTFTGGYSWIDIRNNGQLLTYVPRYKAIGAIKLEIADFMIVLNGQYVKDIYASETRKLDNFLVLNSKIAYSFLNNYRVFVDFNNITNKEYAAYARGNYDYYMPGFNWRAGLSATF